jgi:homoserine kinase type II
MDVYLLWHINEMPDDEEDAKLIGVYASAEDAERAKRRVLPQPGFRDLPERFQVSRYEVGRDHWTEGYITVTPESLMQRFGRAPEVDQNDAADGRRE